MIIVLLKNNNYTNMQLINVKFIFNTSQVQLIKEETHKETNAQQTTKIDVNNYFLFRFYGVTNYD